MDDFFRYVSKAVIIVPIVIIILSLIFKFNQRSKPSTFLILPTKSLSPTGISKLEISLNEKWLCHYKIEGQEYQLKIDNRKIDLEATVSGQFKKYDLSSYASFIETMLNTDISQLESMAKPYLPSGIDFKSLVKSCKKL